MKYNFIIIDLMKQKKWVTKNQNNALAFLERRINQTEKEFKAVLKDSAMEESSWSSSRLNRPSQDAV